MGCSAADGYARRHTDSASTIGDVVSFRDDPVAVVLRTRSGASIPSGSPDGHDKRHVSPAHSSALIAPDPRSYRSLTAFGHMGLAVSLIGKKRTGMGQKQEAGETREIYQPHHDQNQRNGRDGEQSHTATQRKHSTD
jgi:hypothetical protein